MQPSPIRPGVRTDALPDIRRDARPPLVPSPGIRRSTLGLLASLGLVPVIGCGSGSDSAGDAGTDLGTGAGTGTGTTDSSAGTPTGSDVTTVAGRCAEVPEETEGPYPADGSNASQAVYNVLALDGIVRSDIRASIGSATPVAGVPMTLAITLTGSGCAPLAGHAIYAWHCSREGNYSVYTERDAAVNYLRGVQQTDADGVARFVTIVPGCYDGRMPHIHLEIYPSLAAATSARNKIKTTQLAFPTATIAAIYADAAGYSTSVRNLGRISFATDNVFSDGTGLEMVTLTGSPDDGYTAAIAIAIAIAA